VNFPGGDRCFFAREARWSADKSILLASVASESIVRSAVV
jgi:hypothetical protein